MGKDVIIACDFSSAEACLDFLTKFTDAKPFVKIGMELFYAAGPEIVKEIKAMGHKIFLDLKLCEKLLDLVSGGLNVRAHIVIGVAVATACENAYCKCDKKEECYDSFLHFIIDPFGKILIVFTTAKKPLRAVLPHYYITMF